MRALKVRSTVVSLRKLTITQRIIKAGPLPTTWEVAKELNTDHSTDIQHVKQTGKVKRLEKWVPNELTANQKIVLKSCLLLFYAITNYISIRLWPEMKSGFYTTIRDNKLSGWTKKLQSTSQSLTCTKKRPWLLFGGLVPLWSTTAFWIPANVCSANWGDSPKIAMPAGGIGQQNGPNSSPRQCSTTRHTTNASKVEWIGLWRFAFSTWPLTNRLPPVQASQQLFAGKMHPQSAGGRKYFPRVCQIPRHGFLCYRNKQTNFLLAKMHWL